MRFQVADDLWVDLAAVRLAVFDFDGVLTDNGVYVGQDGTEQVRCFRGDGIGLARLRELGVETFVISTEVNPVVGLRCEKLEVPCRQGCPDKVRELENLWEEREKAPETTLFVGNDVNDAPALRAVKVPIIVADAHPSVEALSRYRTVTPGGYGAVREVCDLVEAAHGRVAT